MGYDRQTSPFGTRLYLTCYCLFLLVNILLHLNHISRIKIEINSYDYQFEIILLGFISLLIFSISFYGLWFANILILCFIELLFSILLITTFISIVLITTIHSNVFSLSKNPFYFAHNYIYVSKATTIVSCIISLLFSCLLNIIALCGICHLCSCIEHRHESWPYRRRTSQIMI